METLKSYFTSVGFDNSETETIINRFKPKKFKKGNFFVKEGNVSTQMGFLESGQFQYFSNTENFEEKTTYIAPANTFVASLLTYISEIPSRENIRALEDSVLWIIEKKEVDDLKNQIPKFKDFYIKLIEWQICCIDKSRFDLITLTAEHRYKNLIIDDPEIVQRIPLQYIASMLGITPRHLSRLRNKF